MTVCGFRSDSKSGFGTQNLSSPPAAEALFNGLATNRVITQSASAPLNTLKTSKSAPWFADFGKSFRKKQICPTS